MKLLILKLIFALSINCDMGNIGRYEIELRTKNGKELKANFTIATYDKLESEFKSDNEFKNFIFNIYGAKHLDSLRFFKEFHYINFPEYNNRDEKLTAILKEDWITISKSDIIEMKFNSLKIIDYIGLATQLNIDEIKLLQKEPNYINSYSIDSYQEGYSDLWILSYNKEIDEKRLNQIVQKFKDEYERKTVKSEHNNNSWIYREMMNKWQNELKMKKVYLIEITNP